VALQQHLSIRRGAKGDLALPILWNDNDVTLWPGESIVLTARYASQKGAPTIEVSGWNVPAQSVPANASQGNGH
jgi:exo-1,4-beta-D-glucosaminidase